MDCSESNDQGWIVNLSDAVVEYIVYPKDEYLTEVSYIDLISKHIETAPFFPLSEIKLNPKYSGKDFIVRLQPGHFSRKLLSGIPLNNFCLTIRVIKDDQVSYVMDQLLIFC